MGKPDTITKTVFFTADPSVVWSYLTEKEKLGRWFHEAETDLAPDSDYALVSRGDDGALNRMCWGKVLEWQPHERLVWSFTVKPLGGAMTTVTWRLDPVAGGTRLTLIHEGIAEAAGDGAAMLLGALDAGWDEHLGKLRKL